MKMPRSWFVPADDHVLDLLTQQWETVSTTMDAVLAWAVGSRTRAETIAAIEPADDREREQRRRLHRHVRAAFSTPLDAEDIYELGERIGTLHRQLYLLIREADVTNTAPPPGMTGILMAVSAAMQSLGKALAILPDAKAADLADDAAELLEAADHAYRVALAGLANADIRLEISQRELCRRADHVADAAARIAHRAWYAVCKIS